jgi:hypothetical protein
VISFTLDDEFSSVTVTAIDEPDEQALCRCQICLPDRRCDWRKDRFANAIRRLSRRLIIVQIPVRVGGCSIIERMHGKMPTRVGAPALSVKRRHAVIVRSVQDWALRPTPPKSAKFELRMKLSLLKFAT